MVFEKSAETWLNKSDFDSGIHPDGIQLTVKSFIEEKKGDFGPEVVFDFQMKNGDTGAMSIWKNSRTFRRMRLLWGVEYSKDWLGKVFKARTVPHQTQTGKQTMIWEFDYS